MTTPELLAFPDAIGYGRFTQGGRGPSAGSGQATVYHVTTLEDAIPAVPGSLRHAIVAKGPRIVVFDVAGTIELQRQLTITEPYITIAGQTAPGEGICLKNGPLNMDAAISPRTHDVIISNLKIRPGIGGTSLTGPRRGDANDCIGNVPENITAANLYYRNCSCSWAVDELLGFRVNNATIDNCLLSEALNHSTHSYTMVDADIGHSKAVLAAAANCFNLTFYRTVTAHCMDRQPAEIGLAHGHVDVVNCGVFNWGTDDPAVGGRKWITLFSAMYGDYGVNLVGNWYKPGPESANRNRYQYNHPAGSVGTALSVYLSGNLDIAEGLIASIYHDDPASTSLTYFDAPAGEAAYGLPLTAWEAYDQQVHEGQIGDWYRLNDLGQRVPRSVYPDAGGDAVDRRILEEIAEGSGAIINDPSEVGGWPELDPGQPLDWGPGDPSDVRTCVPKAFAEHYPGRTLDDFLWR